MKCPVCRDANLKISDKEGVEIDYCPSCRGIWLDRGEIDKIIQRSNNKNDNYEDEEENYNNNNKRNKKESFFENIFDVFGGD